MIDDCIQQKSKISEHTINNDCIFCKIIKGDIPSSKVYEDDEFLAFLDIRPVNSGHTLIVPKVHCKNLLDFPKTQETDLMEFIKKVAGAIIKATNADGFNIGMNNGRASGQLVDHAHFHIIPRFSNDGFRHWPHREYKEGEAEEVLKKITSFL